MRSSAAREDGGEVGALEPLLHRKQLVGGNDCGADRAAEEHNEQDDLDGDAKAL